MVLVEIVEDLGMGMRDRLADAGIIDYPSIPNRQKPFQRWSPSRVQLRSWVPTTRPD
jgi:hypothetical protein